MSNIKDFKFFDGFPKIYLMDGGLSKLGDPTYIWSPYIPVIDPQLIDDHSKRISDFYIKMLKNSHYGQKTSNHFIF